MIKNLLLNGAVIGRGCKPYIIAELSGNHQGQLTRCLEMIEKAAK